MATVRITDTLKTEISTNASRIQQPAIEKARDSLDPTWGRRMYDLVFDAETRAKMNALPLCFFKTYDKLTFRGFGDANRHSVTVDVSGLPFPCEMPNDSVMNVGWRGLALRNCGPEFDGLRQEYTEYCDRIAEAERKRDKFVTGVREVLDAYSTLAPALKAWPALWDLVPEDKQEKHKEVTTRRKADKPEIEFDTSSLTAAVTAAKFLK